MKVTQFKYSYNSPIPEIWLKAAEIVCDNMQSLVLDEDLVIQDRQIWNEVERICSRFGYDVYFWPENLLIVPVEDRQFTFDNRQSLVKY